MPEQRTRPDTKLAKQVLQDVDAKKLDKKLVKHFPYTRDGVSFLTKTKYSAKIQCLKFSTQSKNKKKLTNSTHNQPLPFITTDWTYLFYLLPNGFDSTSHSTATFSPHHTHW